MKKAYLLLLALGLAFQLPAQVNVDSLRLIWNNPALADTNRLKALLDISWDLLYANPDSGRTLAWQGLEFARSKGNKRWQGKMWNTIASSYNVQGNYVAALEYYQRGLAAMQEAGDKKGIAAVSNNIGLVYRNMGNNPQAFVYYNIDLKIEEELNSKTGIANAYNNLGTLHNDEGNYDKALEYYLKSLQQMEELKDKAGMGLVYNNIGAIYTDLFQGEKALEYYRKSLAIRQELGDQRGVAGLYNNMGICFKELKQFDQALEHYRKGQFIQERLDDKAGLATSYYYTGITYLDQKAYPQAVKWCKQGLEISRSLGAIRNQRNTCGCLHKAYKGMGQYQQALVYHEQYLLMIDSLQKEETNKRLEQLEFSKQVLADSLGKEEEKLKLQVAYQTQVRKKDRLMQLSLVAGLVVLLLALGFWSRMLYFRRYSQLFQNKAEHLEKQQLLNEIALLKTQVNPHFLFNSLSILSSLVRVNPDLSEQFIDQLSRSYRYILEQKEQSLVTLRTELEFIQSYAFLLKIRFENKFDLRFYLPETALDQYKIAPLTLQLLVENAVKHNRMSLKEPLVVEVLLEEDQFLVVKNRLQPRAAAATSTGLGLQNIINRYLLLTDRPVWVGERKDEFVVKLPLL